MDVGRVALVGGCLAAIGCTGVDPGSTSGSTSGSTTTAAVALDPGCGGGGRAVLSLGSGDSADRASGVVRDADGSTRVFGTVDEPVPAPSVQPAWFASVRLDAACAVDPSYGSGGLGWFAASDPESQPERIYGVRPDDDGGATVFGTSTQAWPTGSGPSDQPAPTVARFAADGREDAGFGARFAFVADPGAPFPDDYDLRGFDDDVDGTTRVLAQSGDHTALLTVDSDGFAPASPWILSADRHVEGLTYAIEQVEGLRIDELGALYVGGTFVEGDGHDAQIPGVLRLGADGVVDPGFGVDGVGGIGSAGPPEQRTAVAVLPGGEVLLAGVFYADDGYEALGVVRLSADGDVDRAFGVAGLATVDLGAGTGYTDHVHALAAFAVAEDGSMVIGGDVFALDAPDDDPDTEPHVGVARLTADGALDPRFADGGVFDAGPLSAGAPEHLAALHVSEDGVVTMAATREVGEHDWDWVVYRLAPVR